MDVQETPQEILIVAGPNGAGKTTFAMKHLPAHLAGVDYINADLIAAGLAPMNPLSANIRAGKLLLTELDRLTAQKQSFAFETTLSGRAYLRRVIRWRELGYKVTLYFLSLPTADEAVKRVRLRVAKGGHNVPEQDVRRRFEAGLSNLRNVYAEVVDDWVLFDNRGAVPVVLERKECHDH